MAWLTLSSILAEAALQVCHPADEPPERPEEAAEEGECACGGRAPGSEERGSALPAGGLQSREEGPSSCSPASFATVPEILP